MDGSKMMQMPEGTITGIGIDLEENKRIVDLIDKRGDHFLQRVFTNHEIGYCKNKKDHGGSFTARFAAKEALLKALGSGLRDGLNWRDIEVKNDTLGKPYFVFFGKTAEVIGSRRVHLSLSHTRQQAMAFVVIEQP